MSKRRTVTLVVTILASLTLAGTVSAKDFEEVELPTYETLEGTIVGYDPETGTLSVVLADGTVETIAIGASQYNHPVVALLAAYYGGNGVEQWSAALDTLRIELAIPDSAVISGIEPITDTGGTVTGWMITLDDGTVLEADGDVTTELSNAFETLSNVSLMVADDNETSTLVGIDQQIAAYHDAGLGFGQLVKIFTIADESQAACEAEAAGNGGAVDQDCAVTVEELAQLALDGMGMGELFATYGKPSLLGVGHVRRQLVGQPGVGGNAGSEGGEPQIASGRDACKNGGWQALGYPNQGQCVSAYNHGN